MEAIKNYVTCRKLLLKAQHQKFIQRQDWKTSGADSSASKSNSPQTPQPPPTSTPPITGETCIPIARPILSLKRGHSGCLLSAHQPPTPLSTHSNSTTTKARLVLACANMPELQTSQSFLEQSALLLEAYPDTVCPSQPFQLQHPAPSARHPTQPNQPQKTQKQANRFPNKQRITTKYSFPTSTPSAKRKRAKSAARKAANPPTTTTTTETPTSTPAATPAAPVASLVFKTYNPAAGICLKYRTNKVAEVSRLMTGLGKLAAGGDVASLGLSGTAGVGAGDVEMVDVGAGEQEGVSSAGGGVAGQGKGQGQSQGQGQGQGGKGKKKGGKGKR